MQKHRDYPTQNEILTALDQEDARQKEALRKFLERERKSPQLHVTGKSLLVFFGTAAATLGLLALFAWWVWP